MPYIGNTAADRFVASKAATQFSGDGSTTAFTLEHSVGSDEDILVSVDGVIQEPSVAYAVSNGTTLTFTAAPSNNSGNNIFVYYLFRTVGTVGHPSNQALTATDGTFSSTLNVTGDATFDTSTLKVDASNNRVGIGTASPSVPLDVGDSDSGSAGTTGIQIQNSQDFATAYDGTSVGTFAGIQTVNHDDTSNRTATGLTFVHRSSGSGIASIQSTSAASDRADLRFVTRGSDGINERMMIDTSGHVTMTNQPAFHAKNNQDVNEFLNASTVHVNIGNHYNNTNGVFTAPTAGNYYFFGGGQSANAGAFYWALYKNGSMYAEFYNAMSGYTYGHASVAAIMTLAENDTVLFKSAGSVNMNTGGQSQFLGYKVS